jgi:hypothetical protein
MDSTPSLTGGTSQLGSHLLLLELADERLKQCASPAAADGEVGAAVAAAGSSLLGSSPDWRRSVSSMS